jgi:hypothetical protein
MFETRRVGIFEGGSKECETLLAEVRATKAKLKVVCVRQFVTPSHL